MPYIRRTDGLNNAGAGRSMSGVARREDTDDLLVAEVAVVTPEDEEITEAEYETALADIRAYNAALPAPAPKFTALDTIQTMPGTTLPELQAKTAALIDYLNG